jgi:hypothetical protein
MHPALVARALVLFRCMKEGHDGLPASGDRDLGVREKTDIEVDSNGLVDRLSGGMSTFDIVDRMPLHRRPPGVGGTSKKPLWSIDPLGMNATLGHLCTFGNHYVIHPGNSMSLSQFRLSLEGTAPLWTKTHDV